MFCASFFLNQSASIIHTVCSHLTQSQVHDRDAPRDPVDVSSRCILVILTALLFFPLSIYLSALRSAPSLLTHTTPPHPLPPVCSSQDPGAAILAPGQPLLSQLGSQGRRWSRPLPPTLSLRTPWRQGELLFSPSHLIYPTRILPCIL